VDQVLEMVQMQERRGGYISALSKGMRQRVGLAQALLHEPEVLILDEPTIGLDPAQIIEVRNIIREIGRERTVLLSTHILSEAQQVCNRVLIINRGKIVVEDTPERLQSRLMGSQRVRLQVAGDTDGLDQVLRAIAGVLQVSIGADGNLEFETQPGRDVRPQVARAVVQAGFDLLEMHIISMSLEDIFLELTRDEPAPPEPEDDEPVDDVDVA
jgi:ABC-2 type transport system ATP-binding protein